MLNLNWNNKSNHTTDIHTTNSSILFYFFNIEIVKFQKTMDHSTEEHPLDPPNIYLYYPLFLLHTSSNSFLIVIKSSTTFFNTTSPGIMVWSSFFYNTTTLTKLYFLWVAQKPKENKVSEPNTLFFNFPNKNKLKNIHTWSKWAELGFHKPNSRKHKRLEIFFSFLFFLPCFSQCPHRPHTHVTKQNPKSQDSESQET